MAYVYLHKTLNTDQVFYVGIGSDKYFKRAKDIYNRNKFWNHVYKKYGRVVEVIKDNISVEEAKKLEVELISKYGRRDVGKGNLCNLTDGGDGMRNVVMSAKTKELIGAYHKGKKRPFKERRWMHKPVIDLKTNTVYNNLKKMCEAVGVNYRSQLNSYKAKKPVILRFEYYDKFREREKASSQ